MSLNDKITKFFSGRYGSDKLNLFLLVLLLILTLMYIITHWIIFDILSMAVAITVCFRMFSRNYSKRAAENAKYMKLTEPVRTFVNNLRPASSVSHKVFYCPKCKQKLRVPKGRGKIEITCPKCRNNFIKRS